MPNIFTNNGYIVSIEKNPHGNVTDEEYQRIEAALRNRPTAPEGYDYRLTTSLEWELYQLPEPVSDDEDAEANDAVYTLYNLYA